MSATADMPASITTPDTVETRLGRVEFDDGAPTLDTAERLYDHLDFIRRAGRWFEPGTVDPTFVSF